MCQVCLTNCYNKENITLEEIEELEKIPNLHGLEEYNKNKPFTKFSNKMSQKDWIAVNILARVKIHKHMEPLSISAYRTLYKCNRLIKVKNGEKYLYRDDMTSMYCNSRFCPVCQSIIMSQRILKYQTVLKDMPELYFVTLTCKCVAKSHIELRNELTRHGKIIRKFTNCYANRKLDINIILKHEITYRLDGTFHPHIHLIIEGKDMGLALIKSWMKENNKIDKNLCNFKAQDIKPCDVTSITELAKYTAKFFSNKDKCDNYENVMWDNYNEILLAIMNKRVFKTYGTKFRKLFGDYNKEDVNVDLLKKTEITAEDGVYEYDNNGNFIKMKGKKVHYLGKVNFDKNFNKTMKNLQKGEGVKDLFKELMENKQNYLFPPKIKNST